MTVSVIALIGISRILLGVHYLSDVVGGWAIGITWLGVTAFAFEGVRHASGERVTDPVTEGLEPEARPDLRPALPESRATRARHRGRIAPGVLVAWVLIVGIVIGAGELVINYGNGNVLGDETIPHWFAAHRTPARNGWSQLFSTLGATQAILIVSVATCVGDDPGVGDLGVVRGGALAGATLGDRLDGPSTGGSSAKKAGVLTWSRYRSNPARDSSVQAAALAFHCPRISGGSTAPCSHGAGPPGSTAGCRPRRAMTFRPAGSSAVVV